MSFRILRGIALIVMIAGLAGCSNTSEQVLADAQQPLASNTADIPQSANAEPAEANSEANSAIGFVASQETTANNSATQVASVDVGKSFAFLPIDGAPASTASSLSKSLEKSSEQRGLSILKGSRTSAKYQVKGYFSAFNDGSGTLLVYVWDVMDENGKRIHRINGREKSSRSATNPWRAIGKPQIDRLANATTANLKNWVEKRG